MFWVMVMMATICLCVLWLVRMIDQRSVISGATIKLSTRRIPQTSPIMRTTFLLILAVCGVCTGNLPQPEVVGDVCYEKDESPVDLDALFNEACTDVEGNIYRVGSELQSCCDCFRLEK